MVDMNQSIENIMEQCDRIAFNEFKGDIPFQYASKRAAENQASKHYDDGTHITGAGKNAHQFGDTSKNWHDRCGGYEKGAINNFKNKNDYEKYNKERENAAKALDRNSIERRNAALRKERRDSKVKKESASIFDALFDQV